MAAFRTHTDQRINILKGVSLLAGCTTDELRRIASLVTPYEAVGGTVLSEQGKPGWEFFVVVAGSATATRNGHKLTTLGPGSFFGELALLDGGERTATVVADSEMQLLVFSRQEFLELHASAPTVAYKMLAELDARLRKADALYDGSLPPEPGLQSI